MTMILRSTQATLACKEAARVFFFFNFSNLMTVSAEHELVLSLAIARACFVITREQIDANV